MADQTSRVFYTEITPFTDRSWYARLVLVVAIAITAVGTVVMQMAISHTESERFQIAVSSAEERITRRMETYEAMLRGAAGHIESSARIDRAGFTSYLKRLDLRSHYPGLLALAWSVPIAPGSEAETVRWLSTQGYEHPRLWPEFDPAFKRMRMAVVLVEPNDASNLKVIGYDTMSEPIRRAAIESAIAQRDLRASGPITLIQDSNRLSIPGIVIYLPVFAGGADASLAGMVSGVFRCSDFFERVFEHDAAAPLTLSITDAAEPGQELFNSTSNVLREHKVTRALAVFGRTWNIEFRSTWDFEQRSSQWLVPWFACAGLILSVGLFLLVRSQVRAVARNAELYQKSTAARREAELGLDINRRLASNLDPLAVAQAVTDAGRELSGASFGAFFTTGGSDEDVAVYALSGESTAYFTTHGLPQIIALFIATIAGDKVIRLDDVRIDPRYTPRPFVPGSPPEPPLVSSYLAVAVRSRTGKVLGGLLYAHYEPAKFSVDHERQLLGLAAQTAIAFDNARLFEAERDARRVAGHRADDLSKANAELQQFIYVSSHDLQEPLRTITQYLDLLQRRHLAHLDDQARRYVTYASDSALRMYLLLNDLLTYSRIGHEAERSAVSLADVIDEVTQDLRVVIAEAHARITFENLPTVRCDRAKIRSLFQNLIGNALKFHSVEEPRIIISSSANPDQTWTISVADNGIGILAEHRTAVFEVFHRLHDRDSFPGTGIGLAICQKVVEQHGGRIWIEETSGGGTTFLFTLPECGSNTQHILKAL